MHRQPRAHAAFSCHWTMRQALPDEEILRAVAVASSIWARRLLNQDVPSHCYRTLKHDYKTVCQHGITLKDDTHKSNV